MSYFDHDALDAAKDRLATARAALIEVLPILVADAADLIQSDSVLDKAGAPAPGTFGWDLDKGGFAPERLAAIRSAEACVGKFWRRGHELDRPWIFEIVDGEREL